MDAKDGVDLFRLHGGCAFCVGDRGIFDRCKCGPFRTAKYETMGLEADLCKYRASTTSGRRGKATSSTSTERDEEAKGMVLLNWSTYAEREKLKFTD